MCWIEAVSRRLLCEVYVMNRFNPVVAMLVRLSTLILFSYCRNWFRLCWQVVTAPGDRFPLMTMRRRQVLMLELVGMVTSMLGWSLVICRLL